MKTNGLIRAITRNGTASILAFVILASASAQVSYSSLKSFSSVSQKKEFKANFLNFSTETESADRQSLLAPAAEISLPLIENKEPATDNLKISFKPNSFIYPENSKTDIGISEYPAEQLFIYAKALKQYAIKNGFDTSFAFLSNMSLLSNKKRFFVINLVTLKIEQTGLVSHGRGQGRTIYDKQYSNESGSRCTSLGRYKILGKYHGKYGEAYRMAGLDSTNRNAFERNIVLHSMGCIPDIENVMPACVSDGCPSVSTKFLSVIGKIIESRKKPMLLWIFDSNLEEPVIEENSGYGEENNKYVLNSEIHSAVENKRRLKPLFYSEPTIKPDLEIINYTGGNDSKPKNYLLKRVLFFLTRDFANRGF